MVNETDNNTHVQYEPETAADFYRELEASQQHADDLARVYNIYNKVYRRCLDQKTAESRIVFSGTFAKTDYVLKECGATPEQMRQVHSTRVRLRHRATLSDGDMRSLYRYDLKNLCLFISLIFGEEPSDAFSRTLPTDDKKVYAGRLLSDSMHIIVEHWDEEYVYGPAEEDPEAESVKVLYAHGNKSYDQDWSYLGRMFTKGCVIGLVRPRAKDGIIYPELIIYEPDYLVDVSTIARCFENYAESPYVNLVKKLQPSAASEATVLGNFASQLLDEAIHQQPDGHTYADSAMEFYRHNAISLLTANVGDTFHAEAQRQQQNIDMALHETLPQEVSHFDIREGMVEPSFYSEMLGLQGRMDYLQWDMRVLLEQKSGKGNYIPNDNFTAPRFREEHYVQMLLYMLIIRYNYREQYDQNGHELHAFLLYSKYRYSLLNMGFAPEMIFRAIKIRNGIAWSEMQFATAGGYDILRTLTPEKLNVKGVSNPLWQRFQYGQLCEVLNPIREASDTEREYYLRMLTFIANEHLLSKIGNKTKENSGFASKWHDSLEEKLQAGNIYHRLTLVSPSAQTEGNIQQVVLAFDADDVSDTSNFRLGDIVILYPYDEGDEPDARRTMVFRASIEGITTEHITLRLRAAQTDSRIFLRSIDRPWAIEHDFMEASYAALYRAMHSFLSAPQSRRDLLMLQREPEVDTSRQLRGDYGGFNDLALRVKQARDFFLIIGPPGTGKTSFGMLNTVKEELLEEDSSVLVLSYTNRAVDEICSKLVEEGIDFVRIGSSLSCHEDYRPYLLESRVGQHSRVSDLRRVLTESRVFVGTTTAYNSNTALFSLRQFTLAVIDEASQILEPHLIGLLSAHYSGEPCIRKMVFIGDHKQLPAVVQQTPEVSAVTHPLLNAIGLMDCGLSLFERLLRRYADDPSVCYMLTRQGRMHRDIAEFPNVMFYGGKLDVVPLPHQVARLSVGTHDDHSDDAYRDVLSHRISFVESPLPLDSASDKVNQPEADIIADIVRCIVESEGEGFCLDDIGIIVPYRNQISTIRSTLSNRGIDAGAITIDTVERYQGSQRKYIIYGFTIQRYYQLSFLTNNVFIDMDGTVVDRKLNVAMTRAKEHLILVGNPVLLSRNATFARLIEFVRKKNSTHCS